MNENIKVLGYVKSLQVNFGDHSCLKVLQRHALSLNILNKFNFLLRVVWLITNSVFRTYIPSRITCHTRYYHATCGHVMFITWLFPVFMQSTYAGWTRAVRASQCHVLETINENERLLSYAKIALRMTVVLLRFGHSVLGNFSCCLINWS